MGAVAEGTNAAELADAADLKSAGGDTVWVRPPPALQMAFLGNFRQKTLYIGVFGKENYLESPLCVIFL